MTVVHRILLHSHDRGIPVCFAVSAPLPKNIKVVLIFLKFWDEFLFHLLHRLSSFLSLMPCLPIYSTSILSVLAARSSNSMSSALYSSFSSSKTDSDFLRTASTLAFRWALFFSTAPFQTNVYLFADDSIFVQSMYWAFRNASPSSLSSRTISFFDCRRKDMASFL